MRDQNPDAASSSSALVGRFRCGSACGKPQELWVDSAALSTSVLGASFGVLEGAGGVSGWGERVAWGAVVCFLGASVSELLFRRFVTRNLRLDVFDMHRALLRNAKAAADATLCVMLFVRGGECRRRSPEMAPTCDKGKLVGPPQPHASCRIDRRADGTSALEALNATIPALQSGAPCVPRPSSPSERLTAAPMASPAFLFIISAGATWSKPVLVAMQTV